MPGPGRVLVVAGFAVLVGRCVVLDLLQKSEELLQVFDLLEVDRDEQLVMMTCLPLPELPSSLLSSLSFFPPPRSTFFSGLRSRAPCTCWRLLFIASAGASPASVRP
jgi:hypothetical protein